MLFTSPQFLFVFLPLFLLLDRIVPSRLRNHLLILFSLIFYAWGGVGYVLLIALAAAALLFARRIAASRRDMDRKILLFVFVALVLSILFYFKYLDWFMTELAGLRSLIEQHGSPVLPLGISFFTFHAISYVADTYRNETGNHSGTDFFAYFVMFPHLVAGPIVRFGRTLPYLRERNDDREFFFHGMLRFVVGLNKKMLIANSVAPMADAAFFADPASLTTGEAWFGALAYGMQIYFDFSGYSDMAIGLAAMMGIRLDENFNCPYQATSIRDFWRRWHVSLSTWLRDYLYIPLGGSRCSAFRTCLNLLAVFLLCGLWHGASFTFIAWGLFHGILLILERTRLGDLLAGLPRPLARAYAFSMVVVAWVFFRSGSIADALQYISRMLIPSGFSIAFDIGVINMAAMAAGMFMVFFHEKAVASNEIRKCGTTVFRLVMTYALFLASIVMVYTESRNPFIYFNF